MLFCLSSHGLRGCGSAFYVRPLAHITMKNALIIFLCSAVIFVSGCATSDTHGRTVEVASLPRDTPDKVISEIGRVLGAAHISADVALGAPVGQPARYLIAVPADKQAEAASLLKQDAAIHKYEIEVH